VRGLTQALSDPVRSVRVGAVLSLVNLRAVRLSGEDARHFEQAKSEYLARAAIHADDGPEQFNLGIFELLTGDLQAAAQAFEISLWLDPRLAASYSKITKGASGPRN